MSRPAVQAGAIIACGLSWLGVAAVVSPAIASAQVHYLHARTSRVTPPDSYLQYKVYSVDQLIEQVSSNPVVRARFARHFHIPQDRVVSYMRANLVESYIPATGRYTVYCVHRSGQFYPVRQTFHQGTKVFALRNGEPVMKWVCGNPLSKFLPQVQVHMIAKRPPPTVKTLPSIEELTPADTQDILVPAEVNAPVFQPLVAVPASAFPAPFVGHAGTSLLPLLLPVALVGIGTSGGHGSTNVNIPVAVPEWGTAAYFAAGLPVVFLTWRRRKSNSHTA